MVSLMKLLICFFNLHKIPIFLAEQTIFIVSYILYLSFFSFNITISLQIMVVVVFNRSIRAEGEDLGKENHESQDSVA